MDKHFNNIGIIVLAAGKGTRLNCSATPKVLCKIGGRPMITYLLETLESSGIPKNQICIVVGYKKEKVMQELGQGYIYAVQEKQMGTAHAALAGANSLPERFKDILVLNGDDSAFYEFGTLEHFVRLHSENRNDITILTVELDFPSGLGRIIRDDRGKFVEMREKENLKPGDEIIKEINTGTYCFNRQWFNKMYRRLEPINGLGEHGLPGLARIAIENDFKIGEYKLKDSSQWFGVNTAEQLANANILKSKLKI